MSYEIDYNGAAFTVNEQGDPPPWGFDQTPLVQAIIDGALVQNGDNFSLSTVDGDFGALYGVKAIYYKSRSSNISSTGILRLNNNSDVISFRNAANSGNLDIKANASNLLIFNGDTVYTIGAGTLTNSDISASAAIDFSKLATLSSGNIILGSAGNVPTSTAMSGDVVITSSGVTAISTGVIVNADVNASAAIDRTKLASGTASHVVINDGGGVMSSEAQVAVTRGGTGQSSYTNGQLLIGNTTGNTLAKATLTGTANQVVVTNSTGSITLSTPQDIGTSSAVVFGSVGVGAALDSASILSLSSTTKGFLPPRLTSTEMNAIASPTTGLTIYNSTSNAIFVYDGASWVQLAAGGSGTVNSGLANTLAYYPSTGTAVDDLTAITASRALVSNASGLPIASVTTTTELSYVSGVTSALQTQLDAKSPLASPTFTGTVTIPTPFTLGAVSVTPTGTELNFVDGVTSAIQTQIDTKAPTASPTFTGTVTIPTPFTLGATSVTSTGAELNYSIGVSSAIQTQLNAKAPTAAPTFTGAIAQNFTADADLAVYLDQTNAGTGYAGIRTSNTGSSASLRLFSVGTGASGNHFPGVPTADSTLIQSVGSNNFVILTNSAVPISFGTNGTLALQITTSQRLLATDGSASLPAYSFLTDEDTGVWHPSANEWAIACGGAERLRVNLANAANDIRIMVYDHTAAAMVQVTRGAADSGGSGFRVLRIPN